jgi:Zn finger protein HypA/HybF involved in hydrogenase expression
MKQKHNHKSEPKKEPSVSAYDQDTISRQHLANRMKEIDKIYEFQALDLSSIEIASRVRVAISYVLEVLSKSRSQLEQQLMKQYHLKPEPVTEHRCEKCLSPLYDRNELQTVNGHELKVLSCPRCKQKSFDPIGLKQIFE